MLDHMCPTPCCDVLLQAATRKPGRKSYSLRTASKSLIQQYFFMTQLPSVFSFVSPMITYFALGEFLIDHRMW